MMVVLWVIVGILLVAFIILVHELGHFLAARAVGIGVQQFSLGFGAEIAGWMRGGTRYSLKWFLAGGSVKILGMDPDEEVSEEDFPRSYYGVSHWKRAVVVLAGSLFHVLLATVMIYLVFWPFGVPYPRSSVGSVQKTIEVEEGRKVRSPAAEAGLKKGDRILAVDGERTREWTDLVDALSGKPGREVDLLLEREGKNFHRRARLLSVDGRGILGIGPNMRDNILRKSTPLKAFWLTLKTTGQMSVMLVKAFGSIFSVRTFKILIGRAERTPESPRSIIGGVQLTVQAAGIGVSYFLTMLAQILVFLAIFNLIPLPPFDGGHLAVIIIEKLFGRRVDMRKLIPVAWVVIVVLSLVALRLAVLDITKPLPLP